MWVLGAVYMWEVAACGCVASCEGVAACGDGYM